MTKEEIINAIKSNNNVDNIFKCLQCCENCTHGEWNYEYIDCKINRVWECKTNYKSADKDYWELKLTRFPLE